MADPRDTEAWAQGWREEVRRWRDWWVRVRPRRGNQLQCGELVDALDRCLREACARLGLDADGPGAATPDPETASPPSIPAGSPQRSPPRS